MCSFGSGKLRAFYPKKSNCPSMSRLNAYLFPLVQVSTKDKEAELRAMQEKYGVDGALSILGSYQYALRHGTAVCGDP